MLYIGLYYADVDDRRDNVIFQRKIAELKEKILQKIKFPNQNLK
jgi:hypothetical protein